MFPRPVKLLALTGHYHFRGKEFTVNAWDGKATGERLYEFNRRHYFPEEARACLDARYFLLNRSGRDTFFIGSRRHQDRGKAFDEVAALGVETVAESGAWVLARRGG